MRTFNVLRRWHVAAFLGALAVPMTACSPDEILAVRDPDIVDPGSVNSAAGAAALYAGTVGEFNFALIGDNGGQEGLILVGGLMSDEYYHSGTFPTRLEYEVRAIDERNGTLLGVFRQAQRARSLAEVTIPLLRQYRPTDANLGMNVGEMFMEQGMIYTFMGETYCSGVPFSQIFPAVVYGQPLTTAQIFTEAVVRFDSAIAVLTGRTDSASVARLNAARVGKGRALLNLATSPAGFNAAAAAVVTVPLDFAFRSTHSTASGRQQNGVMVFNWTSERWSVADVEGTNGLNFRGAADPRITVTSGGLGFDASSAQWNLNKYSTNVTPLPVAQGVEAKLIIAEALLQGGNTTAWLDTLNFLRANAGTIQTGVTLTALTDPGTATGRQDLMFRERAFWLYATGHRLGDLRRLMRQYGRAEDAVFPTGRHFKNTTDYGNDVNVPVPFTERNNPNFTGCLDRNP
jgi:hypothetical protein